MASINSNSQRGRLSSTDRQVRARYVLRHLDDPIALQRSPLCRLASLDQLARGAYPHGVVARGRALNDLARECLREIETEMDGHVRVEKLKRFIALTREAKGVSQASRTIGISREYANRVLKRQLVELFAEKIQSKLS